MEWSHEVTLEFLRLYEEEPVIWNPEDPQHKCRTAVNDAWERIACSISVDCSVRDLKRKKESLMATFRPLLIKFKASRETDAGTDDEYTPNWFAFKTMVRFLGEIYQPKLTINKGETNEASTIASFSSSSCGVSMEKCQVASEKKRRRNSSESTEDKVLHDIKDAIHTIKNNSETMNKNTENYWDTFSKFVSFEIQNIHSEAYKKKVKREIIQCIFKYQEMEEENTSK